MTQNIVHRWLPLPPSFRAAYESHVKKTQHFLKRDFKQIIGGRSNV